MTFFFSYFLFVKHFSHFRTTNQLAIATPYVYKENIHSFVVCICYQFCSWSKQTLLSPPMQAICCRRLQSASSVEISSKITGSIRFDTSDIWPITFYMDTNTHKRWTQWLLFTNQSKGRWISNVLTSLVLWSFINMARMVSLSRFRSSTEMVPLSSSIKQTHKQYWVSVLVEKQLVLTLVVVTFIIVCWIFAIKWAILSFYTYLEKIANSGLRRGHIYHC